MKNKGLLIGLIAIAVLVVGYFVWTGNKNDVGQLENVKIGIITPLSGDGATYGDATQKGVKIAIAEMDSVLKRNYLTIDLIYEDSKLEAKEAINAYNKLVNSDKVSCILGPFGSSNVLAVAKSANQAMTPIFSASATADDIANAGEFVYRNVPSNNKQGNTLAKYIHSDKNIDISRVVIFYLNNDYGISLSKSFENYILKENEKILLKESFEPDQKDFKTSILKIKALNPSFVYLPDHYDEAGLILKQSKQLGLDVIMGGGDGSYSPDLIKIADDGAEGFVLTLMGTSEGNDKLGEFNKAYNSLFGNTEPNVYSVYAYDAMMLYLISIIDLKQKGMSVDGQNIKETMDKVQYNGATGLTIFDDNGEVDKSFSIYEVIDKQFEKIK